MPVALRARNRTSRTARAQAGYGLVVVAALLTAFAAIAAAVLDRNSAMASIEQARTLRQQLRRLNTALAKFAYYNGDRFPCPARYDLTYSDANFGVATLNCHTGTAPAGTQLLDAPTNLVIQGMVPVRELIAYGAGLADAIDPWGGKIMMTVHRNQVTSATVTTVVEADLPTATDYVTGEVMSPAPDVVLLSYGKDRAGAYLRGNTGISITCPASGRRSENCDANKSYVMGPRLMSATEGPTTYFDDFVSPLRYRAAANGTGCVAGAHEWINVAASARCYGTYGALANGGASALTVVGGTGSSTAACTNGAVSFTDSCTGP